MVGRKIHLLFIFRILIISYYNWLGATSSSNKKNKIADDKVQAIRKGANIGCEQYKRVRTKGVSRPATGHLPPP